MRRQESEGNREGMGRKGGYGGRGAAGEAEGETTSISWVCVKVREVIWGGVVDSGRRRYGRSVLGRDV